MINKKQIAQMAKHVLRRQQGLQDPHIMHPEREWAIGLGVALCIFAAATYWSVQIYFTNKDIVLNNVDDGSQGETVYRESVVKEVLEEFATRESESQALLGAVPPPEPVIVASTTDKEIILDQKQSTTSDVVEVAP